MSRTTERAIALALMTKGEDKIPRNDIRRYAEALGVTERSIYRYLDKIARAKFMIK
jgi:predicted transcriptional regulator YheO